MLEFLIGRVILETAGLLENSVGQGNEVMC